MLGFHDAALVGLLGGALSLDRTALVQTMASRPLVGATAAGTLLGEPALGLLAGLLLELLWLMELPVGASVPPDEATAGVVAAALAVAAPGAWSGEARAALGVLLALPFGFLGRAVDLAVRRWNDDLVQGAREALARGEVPALGRAQLAGAVRFFAAGFVVAGVGSGLGGWLVGVLAPGLPSGAEAVLELTQVALVTLGAAAVVASLRGPGVRALFTAGLLGGAVLGNPGGITKRFGWRR